MVFSTKECAWSQVNMTVLGRKFTGLRGFEVKMSIEKEHLYASGSIPVDIQDGNEKSEGNFKMLKYEVDLLNEAALKAGYRNILKVPHTLILATIEYKKSITDPIKLIVVSGIGFTELSFAMEQGAKMTEVTMPFLAIDVQHLSKGGGAAT